MSNMWIHLQNPFLIATKNSYRKAIKISVYLDSALAKQQADPFIGAQYAVYHPLHLALEDAYAKWKGQDGRQQGQTLNLKQLLAQLSNPQIRDWDIAIQTLFAVNTPEYVSLLPDHRIPFQRGTQASKISAVSALGKTLTKYPPLAGLKTVVDAVAQNLNDALTAQKGALGGTGLSSSAVEQARVAAMVAQYAILGAFINQYPTKPAIIAAYFDIETVQSKVQTHFTHQVKGGKTYAVCKHTFAETDNLQLENTGLVPLLIYLTNRKGGSPGATTLTLAPGEKKTAQANQLGDTATCIFLAVKNLDSLQAGHVEIKLL